MTTRLTLAGLVVSVLVLSACSDSDGDGSVKRAQARVEVKERALTAAQSEAAATFAAFCDTGKTYIVALDRYGDVLNASAPTVGDVKAAGTDLAQPRENTTQAAEAAVAAQQQLVETEQELADARGTLAKIQASAGGPSSSSVATDALSTTSQLPPPPPSETVNRVKQAESEFQTAQRGITEQTPLVQASQQFNAAAVALEMSWLALYADAGCLTGEQQKQAEAAVAEYTATLQHALSDADYYQGRVDGVYGPQTVAAVEALQEAHTLPVTGTVDKATAAALEDDLQAKGGAAAQDSLAATAAVQQTLRLAGFWDGPIDGQWTPELTAALKSFQTDLGVKPTGSVDAATVSALERAIATAQQPEQTPSTSVPSTTPTGSVPSSPPSESLSGTAPTVTTTSSTPR